MSSRRGPTEAGPDLLLRSWTELEPESEPPVAFRAGLDPGSGLGLLASRGFGEAVPVGEKLEKEHSDFREQLPTELGDEAVKTWNATNLAEIREARQKRILEALRDGVKDLELKEYEDKLLRSARIDTILNQDEELGNNFINLKNKIRNAMKKDERALQKFKEKLVKEVVGNFQEEFKKEYEKNTEDLVQVLETALRRRIDEVQALQPGAVGGDELKLETATLVGPMEKLFQRLNESDYRVPLDEMQEMQEMEETGNEGRGGLTTRLRSRLSRVGSRRGR